VKILVANFGEVRAWTIPDEDVARLATLAPHAELIHARSPREILDGIVDADVAFSWRVDREALAHATRLRWIQSPAAGISPALLSDQLRRRPILLTNSRGVNALAVAEHAFALVLVLNRDLHVAMARQVASTWAQNELTALAPRLLKGLTLGIVGLGMIGAELARLAHGFGMRVVATRRRPELAPPQYVDGVLPATALEQLLRQSDVVILAAPDTRETTRLIDARALACMKRDALLVNVGRGALVDEEALVRTLAEGRLGGAGLDVFADEPLPATSPLWKLPNVIVTPHVGGVRADYWRVAVDMFVDNLRRFEAGEPLLNIVDKEAGY
jgi:phosphoglycerate dehydrogenase-like enzyme